MHRTAWAEHELQEGARLLRGADPGATGSLSHCLQWDHAGSAGHIRNWDMILMVMLP